MLIAQLLQDPGIDGVQLLRLFRALDFQPAEQRAEAMRQLALTIEKRADQPQAVAPLFLLELAARTPEFVSLEVPGLRKSLGEYGDKLDAAEKEKIEAAIKEVEGVMKGDDKDAIEARVKDLANASQKLGEKIYADAQAKNAGAQAGPGPEAQAPG